jgi:DNA invertase Pin-like site-specific DNA recombinase
MKPLAQPRVPVADVAIVYARLSKEDAVGRAAGVESCDVQIADARRFVASKGWGDEIVPIVDDGVSGAEVHERRGVQQLLALARGGRVRRLVLRDLDRLARDAMWMWWLLAELERSRVEVWTYGDGSRPEVRGIASMMTAMKAINAAAERENASRRIRAALTFRARAGLATRSAPFGYRIEVGPDNRKRLAIDAETSRVVVQIGETFAETGSLRATAMRLNQRGIRGRRSGSWGPQGVGNVLRDPIYRGAEQTHGATRTDYEGGTARKVRAPDVDVLRFSLPELRIWPDDLLARIDEKLASLPRKFAGGAATPRHLASSFVKCGLCGGGLCALGSKKSGSASYVCNRCNQSGKKACPGIGYRSERRVDEALLKAVAPLIGRGAVAERAMAILAQRIESLRRPDGRAAQGKGLAHQIAKSEAASRNLAKAIAAGGDMAPLLEAMRTETHRAEQLKAELARLDGPRPASLDGRRLIERARKRLDELGELHARGGIHARPALQAVLGDAKFTALPIRVNGEKRLQLTAEVSAGYLVSNVVQSPSASTPWCDARRGSPWPLRPRRAFAPGSRRAFGAP